MGGIFILILVLTGFRDAVFRAVPRPLRTGIAVGIGLFITLVGLADAGIVRNRLKIEATVTNARVLLALDQVLRANLRHDDLAWLTSFVWELPQAAHHRFTRKHGSLVEVSRSPVRVFRS